MKLRHLVGERFRERPADCGMDSHALMVRGGYLKAMASGIYSEYPPLVRVLEKIGRIIREEMDAIDGQEVRLPVVLPASLWRESGRYEAIGAELLRLSDRNRQDFVLGMTHEEAAVHLVREYGESHTRYPFMIYQLQTKFRDEARPRGGLVRVREFMMKDAYSFHTSQEDLSETYARCLAAYQRIYARVGLPQVVAVAADSGMMGGGVSHEFMLLTPMGEDSIALCPQCGYHANQEAAPCTVPLIHGQLCGPLTEVETPGIRTIEALGDFLGVEQTGICKAVAYQKGDGGLVVLFLRGDLQANQTKLERFVGGPLFPASLEGSGLVEGFIGPCGLTEAVEVLYDLSIKGAKGLVCGANQKNTHVTGLDMERDVPQAQYHDFSKIPENGICPQCAEGKIHISRGIEVGNIFQLGEKYTRSMGMTYLDEHGEKQFPLMGCYGIGIGRLAASVCEASHDEYGPIWPMSIAPWQIHLCAVRISDPVVKETADGLYQRLIQSGMEVLYDDRSVSAGVQFSDADLLGIPLRVVVSPRSLKAGCCEILARDKRFTQNVAVGEVVKILGRLVAELRNTTPQKLGD